MSYFTKPTGNSLAIPKQTQGWFLPFLYHLIDLSTSRRLVLMKVDK